MAEGRWITVNGHAVYVDKNGRRAIAVNRRSKMTPTGSPMRPGGAEADYARKAKLREREREVATHEARSEQRLHHRTYDALSPTDARKQHRRLYPKGKILAVELAYTIPESAKHPGGRVYRVDFEQ
jgi:hypothetical protein